MLERCDWLAPLPAKLAKSRFRRPIPPKRPFLPSPLESALSLSSLLLTPPTPTTIQLPLTPRARLDSPPSLLPSPAIHSISTSSLPLNTPRRIYTASKRGSPSKVVFDHAPSFFNCALGSREHLATTPRNGQRRLKDDTLTTPSPALDTINGDKHAFRTLPALHSKINRRTDSPSVA